MNSSVKQRHVLSDLGGDVSLTYHELVGSDDGPCLALLSTLHGAEWRTIEILRGVLSHAADMPTLKGRILALPVGNPIAFAAQTRNTPDESDSPDVNRSFGVPETWIACQLANAIAETILKQADAVIDFHGGLWGTAMGSVTCGSDFTDVKLREKSYKLAEAFGLNRIRVGRFVTGFPGPHSSIAHAGEVLGVPGIFCELGGAGFDPTIEGSWLEQSIAGVLNIMHMLGMTDTEPSGNGEVLTFRRAIRVNPTNAGLLKPHFPVDGLMTQEVEANQLLGEVESPYDFSVVEELRSPAHGLINMVCRSYPVRPGDWAYMVVDLDDPNTLRVPHGELPPYLLN